MLEEEKKKIKYGAIGLLYLLTFANSLDKTTLQVEERLEEKAEPTTISNAVAVRSSYGTTDDEKAEEERFHQISGTVKSLREHPPSSYCLKIKSFKTLVNSQTTEIYQSRPFRAGGFNWTFIVYPKGNNKDNGAGYISLYVAIDNSSLIAAPNEVYADLKFFVYNKKEDKYLTVQDTEVKRFHVLRTVWGFSQVLPLDTFNDPKNGYLYDGDHCVFGVDVFVAPLFDQWELFTVTEDFYIPIFSWTLRKFSSLDKQFYLSDDFSMGGRTWNLKLYPNGDGIGEGNSLSLYLVLGRKEKLKPYEKIYVRAKLRIMDQRQSNHLERLIDSWFDTAGNGWGFRQFVSFADLRDTSKGFIVNDALRTQVEFQALSNTSYFFPPQSLISSF